MSEPMTDKRIGFIQEVVERAMTPSRDPSIPPRQIIWEEGAILELLAEVRRLRAEAIVWHPWPGERPDESGMYNVTHAPGGFRVTSRAYWSGLDWLVETLDCKWDVSRPDQPIIAFADLPAPYGGE